jgi:hypothetical protein
MTKFKLDAPITDLEDKPFPDGATLRTVLLGACLNTLRADELMDAKQKVELYLLSKKIASKGDADLAIEEVALLKDRVGKAYNPLVVGRVYEILDPASVK